MALPANSNASASAVGGVYRYYQHSVNPTWNEGPIAGNFSRLDLFVGVGEEKSTGLNGGLIWVNIEVWDVVSNSWVFVESKAVSTYRDDVEIFFYDDVVYTSGTNLCQLTVLQMPFDRYRVTLSGGGPAIEDANADCVYRLNGYAIYEQDPAQTHLPVELTTEESLLSLKPENQEKEIRNHVIVVGARRAVVTDSAKFQEDNPNNPRTEFHLSVVSDPASQFDPDAPNFTGTKRVAVVIDDKVTSTEYARWMARTLLFRNRLPKAEASFEHTAIPVLELRDAMQVVDSRYGSVNHLLWATDITETWAPDAAISSIKGTSYPAIPSYVPREDVDIDAYFGGKPAFNVDLSYLNLYGTKVTRTDLGESTPLIAETVFTDSAATAVVLPAHAIPETVYLATAETPSVARPRKMVSETLAEKPLVNGPYRHFWNQTWSGFQPRLTWDFQEGDGTAGVYDQSYYNFPSVDWKVNYAVLQSRGAENPFYDPYSSDTNLAELSFDGLVSGFYRISVWDANWRSRGYEVPVAWLTGLSGDPEEPEAHWEYKDAGEMSFLYDGSDTIGYWNRLMSSDYAKEVEGDWGDKPSAVGAGFYVWNDTNTDIRTQIGDPRTENYEKDGVGNVLQQYYSLGRYGRFYVRIEVRSDALLRASGATEEAAQREMNSAAKVDASGVVVNPSGEDNPFYLYTHLSEPEQATIQIFDWDPAKVVSGSAVGDWTVGTTKDGWVKIEDYSDTSSEIYQARIREGRPVKMTFAPVPRRGCLFEKAGVPDTERWNGRLARQVHLKRTVFDQFWTFYGRPWDNIREENQTTDEEKRLTSRMFHNDTQTLELQDAGWRTGKELINLEWVFRPSDFEADFGLGQKEHLRYADYEQTESLSGVTTKPSGGAARGERSYLNLAYVADLLYFSAFVQDRSGRRQWCIDRTQVDKSKIVTPAWLAATAEANPAYRVDYEVRGADRYLLRSIFVRHWVEPGWASTNPATMLPGSPIALNGITDAFELKWVQPKIADFNPYANVLSTGNTDPKYIDRHFEAYQTDGTTINEDMRRKTEGFAQVAFGGVRRDWATVNALPNLAILPVQFGGNNGKPVWKFDRGGYIDWYSPSPCRDFHPYWTGIMPDTGQYRMDYYTDADVNSSQESTDWSTARRIQQRRATSNLLMGTGSSVAKPIRDVIAQETWAGCTYKAAFAKTQYDTKSGTAKLLFYGPRLERSVRDFLSEFKGRDGETPMLFDYVRQDELDRFDQYRGVWSRGPYQNRGSTTADDDNSFWSDKGRAAAQQPVLASGVYLLNLANYWDYLVTRQNHLSFGVGCHVTQGVQDWYDLRFRHHYVHQSSTHFPVAYVTDSSRAGNKQAVAAYEFFRQEYTGVKSREDLAYDSGAWTGWKDDVRLGTSKAEWGDMPFLRWTEGFAVDVKKEQAYSPSIRIGEIDRPFLSGGYDYTIADARPALSGTPVYQTYFLGEAVYVKRTNIFADVGNTSQMRLAVGPRTPETRGLVMNLTLPKRLAGG